MSSVLSMAPADVRRFESARRPVAPCAPRAQSFLIRVLDDLAAWQERAQQRRRLLAMDDRMLHDIGVDSAAAMNEGVKPFWRD